MPRRLRQVVIGASPLVRPLAQPVGRSPNQGHSPQSKIYRTARHSLASHRGGRAAAYFSRTNLQISRELTCVFVQSRCVFLAN